MSNSEQIKDKSTSLPKCQVVFILGGPGAGKGTQSQLLMERREKWKHLSAGDLLRAERNKGGDLADSINKTIASGKLVSSEVTCQLLQNEMQKCYDKDKTTRFLIDGFPRSMGNVEAWEKTMKDHDVEFVLLLECPEEIMVSRLLDRGHKSGRSDDEKSVINNRLAIYTDETKPVVEYYDKQGKVERISSDIDVEEIYTRIAHVFNKRSL